MTHDSAAACGLACVCVVASSLYSNSKRRRRKPSLRSTRSVVGPGSGLAWHLRGELVGCRWRLLAGELVVSWLTLWVNTLNPVC